MTGPGIHQPGDMVLDLGILVAIQAADPGVRDLARREFDGFALDTPDLRPPDIVISAAPQQEMTREGELQTHQDGWTLTSWGHRMRITVGRPTRVALEVQGDTPISIRLALEHLLYLAAPCHDGLLLHSAGLDIDGRALVLFGRNKVGKTTSCRNAPPHAGVLSDEGMICRPADEGWLAHATPLHSQGFAVQASPGGRPLRAVVHLVRGAASLQPLTAPDALWRLMDVSGRLGGPATPQMVDLMGRLAEEVPAFELSSDDPSQVWPKLGEVP